MKCAQKPHCGYIGALIVLLVPHCLWCMVNNQLNELMDHEPAQFTPAAPHNHALLLYTCFIKNRTQTLHTYADQLSRLQNQRCVLDLPTLFTKLALIKKCAQKLHNNYFYVYLRNHDLQDQLIQYVIPTFDTVHHFLRRTCPIIREVLGTDTEHAREIERMYLEEPVRRSPAGIGDSQKQVPAISLAHWVDPLINLTHVIYGDLVNLYQTAKIPEEDFIVCTVRQQELTRALEQSRAYVPDFG